MLVLHKIMWTWPYACFLTLKYHPDVNKQPGATEKFKEISAAYEVYFKGINAIRLLTSSRNLFPLSYLWYCLLNSEVQRCQVLSDDKKRALYDQYGEAGVKSTVGASSAYTVLRVLVGLGFHFLFALWNSFSANLDSWNCVPNYIRMEPSSWFPKQLSIF